MTERHYTYQEVWDRYAAGELSTVVLRILLRDDEVFRKWCERKAQAEKRRASVAETSGQLHEQYGPAFQRLADGDEDMA